MASGGVLRHSVSIDEGEVFGLIHRPVELLELRPSGFAGRVASWAEYAERRYGDSITPVMKLTLTCVNLIVGFVAILLTLRTLRFSSAADPGAADTP